MSHFPIPQGFTVMISQMLLTCPSSRNGFLLTQVLIEEFFLSRDFLLCMMFATCFLINSVLLTSPKRSPVSCGSMGSELRLLKSLISRRSRTRLSIIPGLSPACCHYHHHHRLSLLIEPHFCRIFRHCLYSQKSC